MAHLRYTATVLSPLHFWLVYIATGLLVALLAWLGSRRRRLNPRQIAEATGDVGCGHCGYDVRGLPSDICPECGSDLSEVGRMAPQFRRWQRVPPLLRGIVFAAFVLFVGALLSLLALADFVPYRHGSLSTEDLRAKTLVPPGGSLLLLPVTQEYDGWHHSPAQRRISDARSVPPRQLKQTLTVEALPGNPATGMPSGSALARLQVDWLAGTWTITRGTRTVAQGTGAPAAEDVLLFLSLAVFPDEARPTTQAIVERATAGLAADRAQRDEARRLLAAAGTLYVQVDDYSGRGGDGRAAWARLPRPWSDALGQDAFYFAYIGGGTGELIWVTATGDVSWRPSLSYAVPMAAFWLLVLAASIYFATRRRAIKARRDLAETEPALAA